MVYHSPAHSCWIGLEALLQPEHAESLIALANSGHFAALISLVPDRTVQRGTLGSIDLCTRHAPYETFTGLPTSQKQYHMLWVFGVLFSVTVGTLVHETGGFVLLLCAAGKGAPHASFVHSPVFTSLIDDMTFHRFVLDRCAHGGLRRGTTPVCCNAFCDDLTRRCRHRAHARPRGFQAQQKLPKIERALSFHCAFACARFLESSGPGEHGSDALRKSGWRTREIARGFIPDQRTWSSSAASVSLSPDRLQRLHRRRGHPLEHDDRRGARLVPRWAHHRRLR